MNAQSPEVEPKVQPEVQPEAQLEVQPDTTHPDTTHNPGAPAVVKGLRLPEPDRDNITVLLHNLPKDPVLPWNHYDSPWKSEDDRALEEETVLAEAPAESSADLSPETIATPVDEGAEPENPLALENTVALENTLESEASESIPEPASPPEPDRSLKLEVLLDHIPSEEVLSRQEEEENPPTEQHPNPSAGEPGYVHLASPDQETIDQETQPLEIVETAARDADTPIVSAPDSEPDQQLLSQLG
jgi:hypothetical protein